MPRGALRPNPSTVTIRGDAATAAATRRTAAWRILLVDDEPTQRLIMARLLKRAGYEVEMAANGREALAKIDARAISS